MTPPGGSTTQSTPQSVNEVMRSCGGAVQGIKEMPCQNEFYLNRADDGFVYFDCGTYSYGPVKTDGKAVVTYMASLAIPKSRIAMKMSGDATAKTAMIYPKATFRRESEFPPEEQEVLDSKPDYAIVRQLQCRMSSPSQPWMMQRVQWESKNTKSEEHISPVVDASSCYQCWLDVVEQPEDGATMTSMGICCTRSRYVKEVIRSYENGKLTRVTLQEGQLNVQG